MTKSLITLLGALASIAVVALAIVFGVLPLVGQAFTAIGSTAQAAAINTTYQQQITNLQQEKARKAEIDASVNALREQIPDKPDLDQAFDLIAGAAQNAGATLSSTTRGETAAFVPRPAGVPSGPAAAAEQKAVPTPQPTPQPTAGGPVGDAKSAATTATGNANQTSQAAGAAAPPAANTATGSDRQQVPITVIATAPDMNAVQTFLDGLRGSGRLLGVDKVTVTSGGSGIEVRVDLFAFLTGGASK